MCKSCSQEAWYEKHGDELEYLMVTKGYTVKWGTPGETLFCKSNKRCHSAYNKYRRLIRKGATPSAAMKQLRGKEEREVTYSGRFIAVSTATT